MKNKKRPGYENDHVLLWENMQRQSDSDFGLAI